MKKLTKKLTLVLVSVLVVILCIGMMAACDLSGQPSHSHSYSEDWKSDKDNHWKECSCGDKSELAAHVDEKDADGNAGQDEICDICGYNMHEHSYAEAWSNDSTNHWHECSCGAKSDEAAHVDEKDADGNDGHDEKCDICGYDMHKHTNIWASSADGHWNYCTGCQHAGEISAHVDENGDEKCDVCEYNMHVHSYSQDWSKDADNHWHECSCGAKSDEAAHIDEDGNGICDICEYQATLTVTVKDSKGNGIKDVELEINNVVATTDENGVATFNMFAPDHELIYFNKYPDTYYKNASYYTELGTNSYEITLISEVTNTFEIVDQKTSEAISNVTLKLMDGETVVASGTTDSEGKVTLTYAVGKEGKYYYAIEGLTEDQYLSKGASVNKYYTSEKPISINVYTYATYTIKVQCDEGVEHTIEGLTVTVGSYTGTTNAEGVAIIKAPASSNLYTVSVSGLEDGFEAEDGEVGYDWWEMTTTYEATLTIKEKSEGGGSTSENTLVLGTNTVNASYFGESYTLTATEAGDYTISSEDANFGLLDPNEEFDAVWGPGSHTFTLSAGESVTVLFSTYDNSNSDSYDIKVEFSAGTQVTPIPEGFVGNWIDESNTLYTITETVIMIDWDVLKVGEDIVVVSDTEITVSDTTWTLTRDGRILISGEDMDPIYLAVKYPTLYEGENTVDASYYGEAYEFTAGVAGTYIISTESDIAFIEISTGDQIEGAGSVTITLKEGQNILIYFMIQEGEDTQYDVNISQVYPSIELGTTSITTDANGVKYTFTATEAGTYTISCESSNCFIMEKNYLFDTIMQSGSATITLEVGDKFTLCFYTYNDLEDTYDVTISYSATSGGGEGGSGEETITFPEDLRDTWYADMDGDIIEIVISEHSIAMGDIDGSACYVDTDETLGTLYKFSIEGWQYFIYSNGTDWYVAQRQRNNIVSYKLSKEDPTETSIFPEELQGTWYTQLGKELVITANGITFDGTEGINIAATDNDGTTVYTFKVGMASYSLYQSGDVWYLDNNWDPAEELSQTKPVFLEEMPEALFGTWSGVLEDEYGDVEYEYIISAEGISDGYYLNSIADGAIIIISETKIYIEGSYMIYNPSSGTITLDIYGDGTSCVTLSKKLTPEEIVNKAYALEKDESLEGTYTLTGKIISIDTEYSSYFKNVTVTIVVGDMTDKPIKCYRMEGTDADVIAVNDTITVSGTLTNYSGTIEFATGCSLDSYTIGTSTISVDASSSDKATVSITDNKTEGENGSEFTFEVSVESGYEIVSVKVNGTEVTASEEVYTATISGNTTILVETKKEGAADPVLAATMSFATTDNRTSSSTTEQVWNSDGITFTYSKNNYNNNLAEFNNPIRLYAKTKTNITYTSAISKIVFVANSDAYATALSKDISEQGTVTVSGKEVTIVFDTPVTSFEFVLTAQVRLNSFSVYTLPAEA